MSSGTCAVAFLTLTASLAAGWTSVDTGSSFNEVQQGVGERTGHSVRWNKGGDTDLDVRLRMREMLAGELIRQGRVAVWDTETGNVASVRTACSVGYQPFATVFVVRFS